MNIKYFTLKKKEKNLSIIVFNISLYNYTRNIHIYIIVLKLYFSSNFIQEQKRT